MVRFDKYGMYEEYGPNGEIIISLSIDRIYQRRNQCFMFTEIEPHDDQEIYSHRGNKELIGIVKSGSVLRVADGYGCMLELASDS